MTDTFKIIVNETEHNVQCEPDCSLLDVLRDKLRLTGTKRGCDIGVCGSCTVLIDGKPKQACMVKMQEFASTVPLLYKEVLTIEGLTKNGKLHPIQQAFIDCGAIQCGFCTPGMVLTAKALLDKNPNPSRGEIKKALARNLCRCTGYQQIFEAIEEAGKKLQK